MKPIMRWFGGKVNRVTNSGTGVPCCGTPIRRHGRADVPVPMMGCGGERLKTVAGGETVGGEGPARWVARLATARRHALGGSLGGGGSLKSCDQLASLVFPTGKTEFCVKPGQVLAVAVALGEFNAARPRADHPRIAQGF